MNSIIDFHEFLFHMKNNLCHLSIKNFLTLEAAALLPKYLCLPILPSKAVLECRSNPRAQQFYFALKTSDCLLKQQKGGIMDLQGLKLGLKLEPCSQL